MSEEQTKTETTEAVEVKEAKQEELLFSESEYKKFENRRLEYSNALIGTFDAKGDYKITSEILKEFVEMPKVIREIRENRYYAIANSNLGSSFCVKFSVVVGDLDDDKKYATLCLLEDVIDPNTGTYSLKSTPIATYKDDNDGYFVTKMKKAFNLQTIDEQVDGGLYDSNKFPNFFAAKSKKVKLKGQLDVYGEEIDEMYVKEMIAALKKMGPYGAWVLKNFMRQQTLMGDKFPKKGTKGYFKMYARLLDQAVLNAKGFPITPEQVAILNRIQQKRMENVRMATSEVVLTPKPKAKPAAKSAGGDGGKPSGGKKKGGKSGGGGKDDKKEDKKDNKKKPLRKQRLGVKVEEKPKDALNKNESKPEEHEDLNQILEEISVTGKEAQADAIDGQNHGFQKDSENEIIKGHTEDLGGGNVKGTIENIFGPKIKSKERGGREL